MESSWRPAPLGVLSASGRGKELSSFVGVPARGSGAGGPSPVGWLEAFSSVVFFVVPVPPMGTGMAPTRRERVLVLDFVRVPCLNPFLLSSSLLLSLIGEPLLLPFFPVISLSVSVSLKGRGLIVNVIVSI